MRPVFWYSGQFLEPQHFQASDAFHYQQRAAAFGNFSPWPWGMRHLEIDEAALATGLLKVTAAELLFPDGTTAVVAAPREGGNAVIESRDLAQIWPDRHKPLTLRVGLARLAAKGNVAGLIGENLPTATGRYVAGEADEMLADRYALPHPSLSDSGAPVRTLYYYLRLFTAEEARSRGDHYHFPLIRLKDQGLGPRPDPKYCPPLMNLAAAPRMLRVAKGFETRLAALVAHLAPERPDNLYGRNGGAFSTLLSVAAMTLADLRLLLARPGAQPWELFGLLSRALAGLSAALSSDGDMAALTGAFHFDHDAPIQSLAALEPHYRRLLALILPELAAEIPFSVRDGILVAPLGAEAGAGHLEALLQLKINEPVAELLAEGRLLAGSPDDLREAMHRAVPALRLVAVKPPPGLPGGGGAAYLKPDIASPAWQRARAAGELALAVFSGRGGPTADLAAGSRLLFIKRNQ